MIVERANQGHVMYTVFKAKEEIDALARHTMELAEHALASDQKMNSQLESFKHEILARIDAKFAELEKAIIGEAQPSESSAVSDLGAKIALLKPRAPVAAHGQEGEGDHGGHHDQGAGEHHG